MADPSHPKSFLVNPQSILVVSRSDLVNMCHLVSHPKSNLVNYLVIPGRIKSGQVMSSRFFIVF